MEVHQHSHTPRKKWTHYFWEFIMLFLAVFSGFLAENQREHYVEQQREKQFINSLISDIEADTTRLSAIVNGRDLREAQLDSLSFLLNSDSATRYTRDIYFYAHIITRHVILLFTPNDGTMQQLKNAGGLRLIRKHWVTDSIVKYDVAARSLQRLGDQEINIADIYRLTAPEVLNAEELGKFSDADNNPIRLTHNPPLSPGYKEHLNEYNYRVLSIKNINKGYRRETRKLLVQAKNLLITLKKEYHLSERTPLEK